MAGFIQSMFSFSTNSDRVLDQYIFYQWGKLCSTISDEAEKNVEDAADHVADAVVELKEAEDNVVGTGDLRLSLNSV